MKEKEHTMTWEELQAESERVERELVALNNRIHKHGVDMRKRQQKAMPEYERIMREARKWGSF